MSTNPHRNAQPMIHAVDGSTARLLEHAPGQPSSAQPETAQRRRTPLFVVPSGPSRRRAPFALFCFAALVAALATVLVLNISVSTGQYELVKLRNEQVSLAQENQSLTQQIENRLAPQNLASEAAELGMVASPSFGSVDLETGAVTGDPEPAQGNESDVVVPEPAVGAPVNREESGTAGQPGRSGAETPAAGAQVNPAELNGGTIPAPKQQNGQ